MLQVARAHRVNTASCWLCGRPPGSLAAARPPAYAWLLQPCSTGSHHYRPQLLYRSRTTRDIKVRRMYCTARRVDRCDTETPPARLNVRADWVAIQACVAVCAQSRRSPPRTSRPESRDAATPKPSERYGGQRPPSHLLRYAGSAVPYPHRAHLRLLCQFK